MDDMLFLSNTFLKPCFSSKSAVKCTFKDCFLTSAVQDVCGSSIHFLKDTYNLQIKGLLGNLIF